MYRDILTNYKKELDFSILKKKLKVDKTFLTSFLVCLLSLFVTHSFAIINRLYNLDSSFVKEGCYILASSGRFIGEILDKFLQFLGFAQVVPVVNLIFLFFCISASAGLFVNLLNIKNKIYIILISILFALSPSIIEINMYSFTAHLYGVSILFAIVSAYIMFKTNLVLIPSLFIVLSIGIHQGYISILYSTMMLYMIRKMVIDKVSFEDVLKIFTKTFICSMIAMSIYIISNNIYLKLTGESMSGYYGMTNMVFPRTLTINYILKKTLSTLLKWHVAMPMGMLKDYFVFNSTNLSIGIILLINISIIILTLIHLKNLKTIIDRVVLFLLIVLLPLSFYFTHILTTVDIPLLRVTFTLIFYFLIPIILIDDVDLKKYNVILNRIVIFILIIASANIFNITEKEYQNIKSKNDACINQILQMTNYIKTSECYNTKKEIMLLGRLSNDNDIYVDESLATPYEETFVPVMTPEVLFNNRNDDFTENLFAEFANFKIKMPEAEEFYGKDSGAFYKRINYGYYYEWHTNNKTIQEMPVYPNYGCIKEIDGMIVLKLGENFENLIFMKE